MGMLNFYDKSKVMTHSFRNYHLCDFNWYFLIIWYTKTTKELLVRFKREIITYENLIEYSLIHEKILI